MADSRLERINLGTFSCVELAWLAGSIKVHLWFLVCNFAGVGSVNKHSYSWEFCFVIDYGLGFRRCVKGCLSCSMLED